MTKYIFPKKTIHDISLNNKRVLLRADFNVPLNEDGEIDSDFRIKATLPTITYLLKQKAEVVIIAHLGRPDGKIQKKLSLEPVANRLADLLGQQINFINECIGDKVSVNLKNTEPGRVTLLENVRFHKGEEQNDLNFAKELIKSSHPDYVVQDGFGVVHRAHASTTGISNLCPAVAGDLLKSEVEALEGAIKHPQKPLVAIIGGAKIDDKMPLIERFLKEADTILVGGALANTFLKCAGVKIGKSIFEADQAKEVELILKNAKKDQIVLPVDVGVSKSVSEHAGRADCNLKHIHADEYILDIGPVTADLFSDYINKAGTVIWNGTLGYAENPRFAKGSAIIARSISSQHPSIASIIGGGDTADFVMQWQQANKKAKFSHISTGGGASLELLSGKKLPGIEALMDRDK
jgi:phosphoglycerate kinase